MRLSSRNHSSRGREERRPLLAASLAASAALVVGLVSAPAAYAAPADAGTVPELGEVAAQAGKFAPGTYIVTLKDAPASTYTGGVSGYSATKPSAGKQLNAKTSAVQKYSDLLEGKQETLATKVGVTPLYNYTIGYNGFAAKLTGAEAARLAGSSNVASVIPNELLKMQERPDTGAQRSAEYLDISTPSGAWERVGGIEKAGKGVVVGVLDSGIAPENPSFAGAALGTTASSTKPWLNGNTVVFTKNDGNTFTSTRTTGVQFGNDDYNTKLIAAKYYVDGFDASTIGSVEQGEYLSARDGSGHGSHTASTAAGNSGVAATVSGREYGDITGVAPAAKIAAYKVCWSGQAPDPFEDADDGCASADILAAIDQAIIDGVDVINFSIGGGSATSVYTATDAAFMNAAAAGIFVAASAGNSGPGASTLDHAAPWETTVAANTIPSYEATVVLGNGDEYAGASITVPATGEKTEGELVLAESFPAEGASTADANLCIANKLSSEVAGKIVVCERGVNGRLEKSIEVARAGGIGMVLVNVDAGDTVTDDHVIPSIHLDAPDREAIRAYAATEGATATFENGNLTGTATAVPQIAGFSSRGPALAAGSDVLKPDITAPGVSILAASANPESGQPEYEFMSGTSMSSPHIAGIAALYLGLRPLASPAEIKSAMMTSATDTVDATDAVVTDPLAQGAGQVAPAKFLTAGLIYENGLTDWKRYLVGTGEASFPGVTAIDPSNLNQASIAIGDLTGPQTVTRKVTAQTIGTYKATIKVPGIRTTVSPSTLTFTKAGETKTFTVTFERTTASLDTWKSGFLTWSKPTGVQRVVRSPIAIHPTSVLAPTEVSGEGTSGSTTVDVTTGANVDIPIDAQGLAQGILTPNAEDPTLPYTAIAIQGGEGDHPHEVIEGTTFARFDAAPTEEDPVTDLDLYLYYSPTPSTDLDDYQLYTYSATAAAAESIELTDPPVGYYYTVVDYYSTPEGGVPYTDIAYMLNPETNVGNLTAVPSTIDGAVGTETSYDLRWGGLAPDSFFLGFIYYGDTDYVTNLYVETGEALAPVVVTKPKVTGTPLVGETVSIDTGEWDVATDDLTFSYQWLADGDAIEGATEQEFEIPAELVGSTLSAIVTASVGDGPERIVTTAEVTVKATSTTTLTLARNPVKSTEQAKATVTVTTDPGGYAEGTITLAYGTQSKTVSIDAEDEGVLEITLPKLAKKSYYTVRATFNGGDTSLLSRSAGIKLVVTQ